MMYLINDVNVYLCIYIYIYMYTFNIYIYIRLWYIYIHEDIWQALGIYPDTICSNVVKCRTTNRERWRYH